MKVFLAILISLLPVTGFAEDKALADVEEQLRTVYKPLYEAHGQIALAKYDEALQKIRSLYGKPGVDQELILKAETALCACIATMKTAPYDTTGVNDYRSSFNSPTLYLLNKDIPKAYMLDKSYYDDIIAESLRALKDFQKHNAE